MSVEYNIGHDDDDDDDDDNDDNDDEKKLKRWRFKGFCVLFFFFFCRALNDKRVNEVCEIVYMDSVESSVPV